MKNTLLFIVTAVILCFTNVYASVEKFKEFYNHGHRAAKLSELQEINECYFAQNSGVYKIPFKTYIKKFDQGPILGEIESRVFKFSDDFLFSVDLSNFHHNVVVENDSLVFQPKEHISEGGSFRFGYKNLSIILAKIWYTELVGYNEWGEREETTVVLYGQCTLNSIENDSDR